MSNSEITVSLRMSRELRDRLDVLAQATRRSKSFLALEAVTRYVENEEEIIAGIIEGQAQIKAGLSIEHAEVMANVSAIIAEAAKSKLKSKPKSKPK